MANEDREVLQRAVVGDADALTELLKKYASKVRASLSGQIPTKWQSVLSEDDVMQQTYADAFHSIGVFDPDEDGTFSGWLCRIAQCNLADAIRMLKASKRGGQARRVLIDDPATSAEVLVSTLTATSTSPSGRAAAIEAEVQLKAALTALPDTHRTVVQMYDLEGVDISTIAGALDRSEGAVYMLRARAHEGLRALLATNE